MNVVIFLAVLSLVVLFGMFFVGVYLPTRGREEAERRLPPRDAKGRFMRRESK